MRFDGVNGDKEVVCEVCVGFSGEVKRFEYLHLPLCELVACADITPVWGEVGLLRGGEDALDGGDKLLHREGL